MNKNKLVTRKNKIPIIFDGDEGYTMIDTETVWQQPIRETSYIELKKEEIQQMKTMKTKYMLIKRTNDQITMEQEYHQFIQDADELLKETNGLINMYRTGRDALTAIELAYHFLNKNRISAEPITNPKEARWIEESTIGPLLFGFPYEGEAHVADINSSYPSIYSSQYFMIPIKEGEFMKMTSEHFEKCDKFLPFGIYHAKIKYPDDDIKWRKLFKLNEKNKYTHIDVMRARKIGLKIRLNQKAKSNFLHYSKEKCLISGKKCFKEYVTLLYELRTNEICGKRCKSLLSTLWGALMQKNEFTKILEEDEVFEIYDETELISSIPFGNGKEKITYVNKNKMYKTNYARMKPFLLAKGRVKISEYIEPYVDHVYRCHTDSMTSDIKLPLDYSTKLGGIKYDGHYPHCIIKNCSVPKGEYIKKYQLC
jgi:hypothetical protein